MSLGGAGTRPRAIRPGVQSPEAPEAPEAPEVVEAPEADDSADGDALCRPATEAEQVAHVMDLTADDSDGAEELVMDDVPKKFDLPGTPQLRTQAAPEPARGSEEEVHVEMEKRPSKVSVNASLLKGPMAECCICFAELPSAPVCMLMSRAYGKQRACRHYLHHGCIKLLMRSTPAPYLCPLCRAEFVRGEALPDVRLDGAAWFRAIDNNDSGTLEKCEVIDALCATLPADPEKLRAAVDGKLWAQWDLEGGGITREAFEHPTRGMLQFVLYSLPSLKREVQTGAIPDFEQSRESWFRYWDEDNARELDFLVCLRALARSLCIDGDCADMATLRQILFDLFQEFGLCEAEGAGAWSAHGIVSRPLTQKLFCERPDGFCDRLVDALGAGLGRSKLRRLRERARLWHLPAAALKRRLKGQPPMFLEKAELVNAILDQLEFPAAPASSAKTSPKSAPAPAPGPTRAAAEALSIAELKQRLRALGVSYHHCLERRELEELLLSQGRPPDGGSAACAPERDRGRCFERCRMT